MKTLLILLIFVTFASAVDYCEMGKLCGSKKHIGCDKNVIKIYFILNSNSNLIIL